MAGKVNLQTSEAVQEIKTLIKELKNLDKTLGTMSKGNVAAFNKMNNSMSGFSSKIKELNNSIERLSGITKTNSKRLTRNSNELNRNSNLTKTASKNTRQQTRAILDNTKALRGETTQTERNTSAKKKNQNAGKGLLRTVGRLAGALGFAGLVMTIGTAIKSIVQLTIRFQSLGYAVDKIAGENFAEIKRTWEFLIQLNDNFGAKLSVTTERWLKFRAAAAQSNLTLKDTMSIFESVTKASAVLGLNTDELKGVYLALEQMLSKGKVTTEELRRQLGERLPGAMGIMAKAIGVSISELDRMMKKGEVLSSYALPRFAEALEEAYGIESLEKVENLSTAVGKMSGAWDRFVLTVSEGDSLLSNAIGGTMKILTSLLNQTTNFLETYNQTANRTSGTKYGEEVSKILSDEIEQRLRLNGTIIKTEEQLEKELKAQEKLASKTIEGTKEREEALKNVMKAAKDLEDFQKKKAEEGSLLAISKAEEAKEELDRLEKLRDAAAEVLKAERPVISSDDPTKYKIEAYAEYNKKLSEARNNLSKYNKEYTKQLEYVKQLNELIIPTGGTLDTEEEDTKTYRRKIRLAKEWESTNKLLINSLKEVIRQNEKFNEEEKGGLVERSERLEYNANARKMIADLELEDALKANDLWLRNQKVTLDENLEAHKNNAADYAKQVEENKKQLEAYEEEHEEKKRLIQQKYRLQRKKDIELEDKENRELIEDRFAFVSEHLTTEKAEALKHYQDKLETIRKGGNEEKKLLFAIQKIEVDYHNLMVDNRIEQLEWELEHVKTLGEKARILKEIRRLEASKKADPADEYGNKNSTDGMGSSIIDPIFAEDFATWSNMSQEFINEMFGLADAIYEHRIQRIEQEISAEEAKYDRLLELAKNDEEETKIIERNKALAIEKLEKKKRKEQIKQAKLDKALKISQATQSTALAIVNALTVQPPWLGIALSIAAGITGAAQIAAIAATPIPQFADGGVMDHDGKALINDGGKQEYVERNGKVLTTGTTNAIVDLKKGDVIHKDFETLQRKSLLLSLTSGGGNVTEKELNLAFGIKEEIKSGFKKAKIESNVVVINKSDDYRNKMSLWD